MENPSDAVLKSNLAQLILKSKHIVVLCGAGISVNCGIPDFRSPDVGIYSEIEKQPGFEELPQPECLFDIEYFRDDPAPFYLYAPKLYFGGMLKDRDTNAASKGAASRNQPMTATLRPSTTHNFFAELDGRKKLLRVFSQNIDGLEIASGLSPSRVIQCHGTLRTLTCMDCKRKFAGAPGCISEPLSASSVAYCGETAIAMASTSCGESGTGSPHKIDAELDPPAKKKRRRSRRSCVAAAEAKRSPQLRGCRGVLKPDVTFFGEKIKDHAWKTLVKDSSRCDLLLVIGTSLQVKPLSQALELFSEKTSIVLINKENVETVTHRQFDVKILGDCDEIFRNTREELAW